MDSPPNPVIPKSLTDPESFDAYLKTIEEFIPVGELPPEYRRFLTTARNTPNSSVVAPSAPSMNVGPVDSHNTAEYTCKCGRCQKAYDPEDYKTFCHLECVNRGPKWWQEVK